jgi:hypothetical protein
VHPRLVVEHDAKVDREPGHVVDEVKLKLGGLLRALRAAADPLRAAVVEDRRRVFLRPEHRGAKRRNRSAIPREFRGISCGPSAHSYSIGRKRKGSTFREGDSAHPEAVDDLARQSRGVNALQVDRPRGVCSDRVE